MKLILVRNDFQLCPRSLTLCLPCCCESRGTVPHRRLESRKFNFFLPHFSVHPHYYKKKAFVWLNLKWLTTLLSRAGTWCCTCLHWVLEVSAFWVSDHHRSTDGLSGWIWNDTVVPFCSSPWGTLRKDCTRSPWSSSRFRGSAGIMCSFEKTGECPLIEKALKGWVWPITMVLIGVWWN